MVLNNSTPNTTAQYTMTKNSRIQFNLTGNGVGTAVIAIVNGIPVIGFQHISCDMYYSLYCRKGDTISIKTIGTASGQAYTQ